MGITHMNKPESKRERFKRLATIRTNTVLHRIKVLGHCANRQIYEYTEDDIKAIFWEIERSLKEIRGKFHSAEEREFKL